MTFRDYLSQVLDALEAEPDRYPHPEGDVTVLGPQIFASPDGEVISWKGDNYVRQAELTRAEAEPRRYTEAESANAAAGSYAGRAERVEAQLAAVAALYGQWVKAGPPPLGTSMARWWDRRLAELRDVIRPPAEELLRTTPDNPPTSSNSPDNPLEERIRTLIESEVYEYRERTMFWEEGGITTEIARLATRGALEALDLTEPAPPPPRDPCPHCEASSDRIPRAELGQHIAAQHPDVTARTREDQP